MFIFSELSTSSWKSRHRKQQRVLEFKISQAASGLAVAASQAEQGPPPGVRTRPAAAILDGEAEGGRLPQRASGQVLA